MYISCLSADNPNNDHPRAINVPVGICFKHFPSKSVTRSFGKWLSRTVQQRQPNIYAAEF